MKLNYHRMLSCLHSFFVSVFQGHLVVYNPIPDDYRENEKPVALFYAQLDMLVIAYPRGIVYVQFY